MTTNDTPSWGLVMPFIDKSESFVLGFECGEIWEQLKHGALSNLVVHTKNIEQITMIARHYGYWLTLEPTNVAVEGWHEVSFVRRPPLAAVVPAMRRNPHLCTGR